MMTCLTDLPVLWAFMALAGLGNYNLFLYGQQAENSFHIFKGLFKKKGKEEYATETICGQQSQ